MNTPFHSPARANARVALVTCAELPELEPDDRLPIVALENLGVQAIPTVWDDPLVDWSSFDLVVLRSPWDYMPRRDEFVAWARSVRGLLNPAEVVRWNTDKRYLAELAAAGVPVIPTVFVAPGDQWQPPAHERYVIKPTISAGSRDTGLYGEEHRTEAIEHVSRLQRDGRLTMIQPYLPAVDTYGETSLLYFADPESGGLAFSHAIRKGPMLSGPDAGVEGLYKEEAITRREPTPAELAVGEAVLAAVQGFLSSGAQSKRQTTQRLHRPVSRAEEVDLLYARVDLIPDPEGNPLLIELELTEPSLFFEHGPGSADRFAGAIAARLG